MASGPRAHLWASWEGVAITVPPRSGGCRRAAGGVGGNLRGRSAPPKQDPMAPVTPSPERRMPLHFRYEMVRGVHFFLWSAPPTDEDAEECVRIIATLRPNEKILVVGVAPLTADLPTPSERLALRRLLDELKPHCEHYYTVLSGDGARQKLLRAFLIAVSAVTSFFDGTQSIHATVDEIADDLGRRLKADGTAVIAEARERGLVV